jgi:membrane protein
MAPGRFTAGNFSMPAHSPGTSCPQPLSLWGVVKATFKEWSEDKAATLSAAFAYYGIFSIGPLLIIAIAIVSIVYGQKAANDQIRPQLTGFVGAKGATYIQDLIHSANVSPSFSVAGIISIVLLLYAATNVFATLQASLNVIFDVEPRPGRGIMAIVKDRAMTFLMVLLIGAFVLASVVLNTLLSSFTRWGAAQLFPNHPAVAAFLLQFASFLVSAIVFTGVFALLFKYLPDVKIQWKDTLIGAVATSILFTLARIGLGYYLSRGSTAGPFGAAGALVIVMLFIYYSAQIVFLGAEFTQVWACRSGHPIEPSRNAIFMNKKLAARFAPPAKKGDRAARSGSPWRFGDGQSRDEPGDGAKASRRGTSHGLEVEGETQPLSEGYPASRYHPPMS